MKIYNSGCGKCGTAYMLFTYLQLILMLYCIDMNASKGIITELYNIIKTFEVDKKV